MMGPFPLAIYRYYATNSMVYNSNQKNIFKNGTSYCDFLSDSLLLNAVRLTNHNIDVMCVVV